MKKLISLFSILFLFSCSNIVDKPKDLLSKEKMSEVIADFAIYDQSYTINPNTNMEINSRFVLKNITLQQQCTEIVINIICLILRS